jgi:HD-GYP domain-containing protein (c-di-GMP phosphodiesterase class II)
MAAGPEGGSSTGICPTCGQAERADPQVLRAIADIRTLRSESLQERKAREAAEADLHQKVLDTVRLLLSFLERRWPERVAHCRAAARLAGRLAESGGLKPEDVGTVQIAALLQDVGLIAVPDALLRTTTTGLGAAERALYQQHPVIASDTLGGGGFANIGLWIRHHHERWDGAGYPDGLAGDGIPLPARIVALATAYIEAVSRDGGSAATWRREQVASGAFDPSLVKLLDNALRPQHV